MTERADKLVFEKGLARSRSAAQALIAEGKVFCGGRLVLKPSEPLDPDAELSVSEGQKYVSRGGIKLEYALDEFGISVLNDICADIGASTGGFTDCLLQRGAARVYALEVGHGQLDPSLLSDSRVVSIENFNARDLCPDTVGETCDTVVMDVSFISQTYLHAGVSSVLRPGGKFISLIKPQFEAGRAMIKKHGIADSASYGAVIDRVVSSAASHGLSAVGVKESVIKGGDGNTEFIAYFIKRNGELF